MTSKIYSFISFRYTQIVCLGIKYLAWLVCEVGITGFMFGGLYIKLEERGGKPEDVVSINRLTLT